MEVSIEIKESEYEHIDIEPYRGFFGGFKTRTVSHGRKKRYTVELTLVPTEEERAIILKYKLDELAVETEPKYTAEFLENWEASQREIHDRIGPGSFQRVAAPVLAQMRQEKQQTLLGNYFDNPYTKSFDVRQDAHTHADKLEKEILPIIKTQIDYYRIEAVRQDKRTFTL